MLLSETPTSAPSDDATAEAAAMLLFQAQRPPTPVAELTAVMLETIDTRYIKYGTLCVLCRLRTGRGFGATRGGPRREHKRATTSACVSPPSASARASRLSALSELDFCSLRRS